ncbi:hypothetical protein O2K51_03785 [Apibacter raozihei]|uniref:acyltransferase n=1 Tax=Apibacter raozihei TaxID=2500547 RepID=UPI000FE41F79|nr:hypothetical protein [Apibacter raozihei]
MKKILAVVIAFIPFNILRIFLYRNTLKYNISYNSKIKPLNFILCQNLKIYPNAGFSGYFNIIRNVNKMCIGENSFIVKFNRFSNLNNCIIKNNVIIVSSNVFFGTSGDISPFKEYENIKIGQNSIITNKHSFDLSDEIIIGEDVTIGGSGSQLWTHGFDLKHVKKQSTIKIGNNCYMGSKIIILPGCNICDQVSVGSGTVVSKSINSSGFYVSTGLVKKSEVANFQNDENVVKKNGYYFLRK